MADISPANLDKIESKLDKLLEKVAKLEALAATESDRCPFREEVARAANNVARLERLSEKVDANTDSIHALRRDRAMLAGAGAVAGSLVGGGIWEVIAKLIS